MPSLPSSKQQHDDAMSACHPTKSEGSTMQTYTSPQPSSLEIPHSHRPLGLNPLPAPNPLARWAQKWPTSQEIPLAVRTAYDTPEIHPRLLGPEDLPCPGRVAGVDEA